MSCDCCRSLSGRRGESCFYHMEERKARGKWAMEQSLEHLCFSALLRRRVEKCLNSSETNRIQSFRLDDSKWTKTTVYFNIETPIILHWSDWTTGFLKRKSTTRLKVESKIQNKIYWAFGNLKLRILKVGVGFAVGVRTRRSQNFINSKLSPWAALKIQGLVHVRQRASKRRISSKLPSRAHTKAE